MWRETPKRLKKKFECWKFLMNIVKDCKYDLNCSSITKIIWIQNDLNIKADRLSVYNKVLTLIFIGRVIK